MATNPEIAEFFSGKPIQLQLFQAISDYIESIGKAEVEVTRAQISFRSSRQFAWVWLPVPWDHKRPPNSIVLSFSLGRRVDDPPVVSVVEPYPGRWMHHVIIEREADLNGEVRAWLGEAYEFGGRGK